jgi:hypothetical protein
MVFDKELNDAYVTLCVKSDCSDDELKKQYRTFCLKYHPDKYHGNSKKFIQIQEAYTKIQKSRCENPNQSTNLGIGLQEEMMHKLYIYMMCLVFGFFTEKNIHLYIDVEIEDIYSMKIKRITYQRINPSMKKESNTVFLELYGLQKEYVLSEYGDYNTFTKKSSDLIIHVNVVNTVLKSVTYEPIISPYELYITIQISIYEYYFGINRAVPYLNNEMLQVTWTPVKQGTTIIMDGFGLPDHDKNRGVLYCMLNTDMSLHNIKESERDIVYKLFGGIMV